MNFPAVILFICFSAAYGHQFKNLPSKSDGDSSSTPIRCKVGDIIKVGNKVSSKEPITMTDCPLGERVLCVRQELLPVSSDKFKYFIKYFCSNDARPNPGNGYDACKDAKDGQCGSGTVTVADIEVKATTCCTSDSEFKSVPPLTSAADMPETDKPETGKTETGKTETGKSETSKTETGKPSSTFSARPLFAVIITFFLLTI